MLLCLVVVSLFYPLESLVIPTWKVRVVDTNGVPCPGMQVNEGWGDYSLELQATGDSDFRFTNQAGYVEFPARTIRASPLRRIVVPLIANVMVLAHGSTGIHGYVFASGMRENPALEYEGGQILASEIEVEQCYDERIRPSRTVAR